MHLSAMERLSNVSDFLHPEIAPHSNAIAFLYSREWQLYSLGLVNLPYRSIFRTCVVSFHDTPSFFKSQEATPSYMGQLKPEN